MRRKENDDDVDLSFPSQNTSSKESIVELGRHSDSSLAPSLTLNILAYTVVPR